MARQDSHLRLLAGRAGRSLVAPLGKEAGGSDRGIGLRGQPDRRVRSFRCVSPAGPYRAGPTDHAQARPQHDLPSHRRDLHPGLPGDPASPVVDRVAVSGLGAGGRRHRHQGVGHRLDHARQQRPLSDPGLAGHTGATDPAPFGVGADDGVAGARRGPLHRWRVGVLLPPSRSQPGGLRLSRGLALLHGAGRDESLRHGRAHRSLTAGAGQRRALEIQTEAAAPPNQATMARGSVRRLCRSSFSISFRLGVVP